MAELASSMTADQIQEIVLGTVQSMIQSGDLRGMEEFQPEPPMNTEHSMGMGPQMGVEPQMEPQQGFPQQ